MIIVDKLYKGFDGTQVLKGISASFESGKTSLIIGQSGSGKTVFLKSLIGLHVPESGTISFDGAVNTQFTIEQKRQWRQEIGMVFQGSALFDSQTVQENVMFPLKMFKKQSQEEMIERVNFVLKRVNLENSNFKFSAELSGGMQKRVAIARALVSEPKILLLDEPAGGLGAQDIEWMNSLIHNLSTQCSVILVEHHMDVVMSVCDRLYVLNFGEVIASGDVENVRRDPAVIAAYLGVNS